MGNSQVLQPADRDANRSADMDAKRAVEEHRVPEDIRNSVAEYENAITTAAGWLARATLAASNLTGVHGTAKRDSCASRRAAAAAATHRATVRAQLRRERAPLVPRRDPAEGGHQLAYRLRQWHCKCCMRSGTWDRMAGQRCQGPPEGRWASSALRRRMAALRAASSTTVPPPLEHQTRVTADITWCEVCGAYAHTRARLMNATCPGAPAERAGGGRQQQLYRLRKGLHPHTGQVLGEETPAMMRPKRARSPATRTTSKRKRGHADATDGNRSMGPRVEAIRQRLLLRTQDATSTNAAAMGPAHGDHGAADLPAPRILPRLEAMRLRIAARADTEHQDMEQ